MADLWQVADCAQDAADLVVPELDKDVHDLAPAIDELTLDEPTVGFYSFSLI